MAKGDPNRNLVAALSYFLGFVTGIVILLVEKENKFIRFHAMQSTLVFGGLFIANALLDLVLRGPLGVLVSPISVLLSLVAVIVWLVSMARAFRGEVFRWPIVGKWAERATS